MRGRLTGLSDPNPLGRFTQAVYRAVDSAVDTLPALPVHRAGALRREAPDRAEVVSDRADRTVHLLRAALATAVVS